MGTLGPTDGRIITDNHAYQRRLVPQLDGQMGAASVGHERRLHALIQQRPRVRRTDDSTYTALMYIDGPTLSVLIQLVLGLAVFVLVGRFIVTRLGSRD